MTTGEILRSAAARVRRGWLQGYTVDMAGRVCAYGALGQAHRAIAPVDGKRMWQLADDACVTIQRVLRLPGEHASVAVAEWNDAKGQTAEAVANALEFVAVIVEQEEALAQVAQPVMVTR